MEENESCVLCLDIFSVPYLAHYWVPEPIKTSDTSSEGALMRPAETFLDNYNISRLYILNIIRSE